MNDEFTVECPRCNVEVYVWPNENSHGFFAASEDPVSNSTPNKTNVKMAEIPRPADNAIDSADAYPWLYNLSIDAGHAKISESLRSMYGTVGCPECKGEFNLMEELKNAT